jgi:hypothetical protein
MKAVKINKIIIVLLLVSITHIAMGSFTGTEKKLSNLYSLKSFNKNFYKNKSSFFLRSGFQYKGTRFHSHSVAPGGDITFNSMMRYEKGNTTYIYPYTHKVSVSKFKTPSPPTSFR